MDDDKNVPHNPDANKYDNEEAVAIPHVEVKVLSVPCTFQGGAQSSVNFYIGDPKPDPKQSPIHNQLNWLSSTRGGTPPEAIINSLTTLQEIAIRNNIPLGELCEYAIKSVSSKIDQTDPKEKDAKKLDTSEVKETPTSQLPEK